MRILAFDTSTEWCSIAAGDGATWHVRDEHVGQTHSERALAMVDAVLAEAGWTLGMLTGIAFGAGPGSFTGLRIGCGIAQGLALGASLPVVAVPTLQAVAHAAHAEGGGERFVACLDARMREVYVAAYARDGHGWSPVTEPEVLPPDRVVAPPGADWIGAGNGFAAWPELASRLGLAAVRPQVRPTATAVGALAAPTLAAGGGVAAAAILPFYVRHRVALTTAERASGARL
jgi:tRNA threonylcarbamoyladenosine biosynthesis protein TsaB